MQYPALLTNTTVGKLILNANGHKSVGFSYFEMIALSCKIADYLSKIVKSKRPGLTILHVTIFPIQIPSSLDAINHIQRQLSIILNLSQVRGICLRITLLLVI